MSLDLLRALLTILFGALAGGLTNTLAIWMLFHPHHPPRLGRWRLRMIQGAVPKNQDRLAAAIGRTVGGSLLTEADLTRTLANPEFRAAFDQRLAGILGELLERERGPLPELVPPELRPRIRELAEGVASLAAERLEAWLDSEDFPETVEARMTGLLEAVEAQPVSGLLTPAREAAVQEAVEGWLADAVSTEGYRRGVEEVLERLSRQLLEPGRTFQEVLPAGMVGAVEKGIQAYLPLAIQRLGSLLEDPGARSRFQRAVHDLLQRFLGDLRFHQRIVARLVVREDTVDRVLDTIEAEGAEHLAEMLRDPDVQTAMARGINQAVLDFLRRPVSSVLGDFDDPSVVEARRTVADWFVTLTRDPGTRAFLVEKLDAALDRAGGRNWGEVLSRIPPERAARWVVAVARSPEARGLYADGIRRLVVLALARPIGRPDRWLPEGSRASLESALGDPIWEWVQGQVPEVARRMDVARRVEDKVRAFPVQRMEELVRKVTERELRLIVRLGYLLGAMIGLILVGLNALL